MESIHRHTQYPNYVTGLRVTCKGTPDPCTNSKTQDLYMSKKRRDPGQNDKME